MKKLKPHYQNMGESAKNLLKIANSNRNKPVDTRIIFDDRSTGIQKEKTEREKVVYHEITPKEEKMEFEKGIVFVGMSFKATGCDDVYSAIKDVCKSLRLKPIRVDENKGSGVIIFEITELIDNAEFIIIDLTHERPNVYYELGFAHGRGNTGDDILLVAEKSAVIHFDIAANRVHEYTSTEQLRRIVRDNLKKMISISKKKSKLLSS